MKGIMIYKKHYSILQNMMMDEVCNQVSEGKYIDLNLDIKTIEEKIDNIDADYILIWYYNDVLQKLKPISRLGIPIIMTSDDPWGRLFEDDYKKMVEYHKVDGIILQTKNTENAFREYLKEDKNFFWLPWGINPNIMRDYKEKKIWDISISGKFSRYEWRRFLDKKLMSYPKYHRIPRLLPPQRSWEDYAKDINRSKISLGGCNQQKDRLYYKNHFICETFAKTLEIPACNTCLINTNFADKEELGFKDGVNFIEFNNEREFFEKIRYYLKHDNELDEITRNGYELVQENYTTKQQVERLIKGVKEIYG